MLIIPVNYWLYWNNIPPQGTWTYFQLNRFVTQEQKGSLSLANKMGLWLESTILGRGKEYGKKKKNLSIIFVDSFGADWEEQSLLSARFLVSGGTVTKAVLLRYCQVSKFSKAVVLNLPSAAALYCITIKLCFLLICNWFLPVLWIYNVNICFLMVIEHVCGSFTFKGVMTHRLRISALKTFQSLSVLEFFFLTGLISSFYWGCLLNLVNATYWFDFSICANGKLQKFSSM